MNPSLAVVNHRLKRVGRLPRITQSCLLVFAVVIGGVSGIWGNPSLAIAPSAVALALLLLSLRIRAWATADTLVIRSYLRTYVVRFDDVEGFIELPYAGLWNGGVGTEGWMNFGWRMLDINYSSGRSRGLPATMMSAKDGERLEDALNGWLYRNDHGTIK